MRCKSISFTDFQDYKKISMLIGTCFCDWKCCKESNLSISTCQNQSLCLNDMIEIPNEELCKRYINDHLTKAVVFGGLEPILQIDEILLFIDTLRSMGCDDDVVIYTGYYPEEVKRELDHLKKYKNIIVKFGRYRPNGEKKYDDILGIELASKNQYAMKIS